MLRDLKSADELAEWEYGCGHQQNKTTSKPQAEQQLRLAHGCVVKKIPARLWTGLNVFKDPPLMRLRHPAITLTVTLNHGTTRFCMTRMAAFQMRLMNMFFLSKIAFKLWAPFKLLSFFKHFYLFSVKWIPFLRCLFNLTKWMHHKFVQACGLNQQMTKWVKFRCIIAASCESNLGLLCYWSDCFSKGFYCAVLCFWSQKSA